MLTGLPETNSSQTVIRPFYPALDGLRAVAFLLIFAFHYCLGLLPPFLQLGLRWGWAGVDLFFVLSGFLITGILYDTLQDHDYFKGFYIRRALRIFPLFYGFWVAMVVLTPFLHILWTRYLLLQMVYLGNFTIPGAVLGHHPPPDQVLYFTSRHPGQSRGFLLGHLWSLCVEEQFYFVWPAVLWFVRGRRALLRLCLLVFFLLPVVRAACMHFFPIWSAAGGLNFSTFCRCDGLFAGAALALWLRGPALTTERLRNLALLLIFAAPTLLAICFALESTHSADVQADPVVLVVGFTFIAICATGVLLLTILPQLRLASILSWTPLRSLGRISYGMYFFHLLPGWYFYSRMAIWRLRHLAALGAVEAFLYTYIAAWLSFRFLESPFLRLKSRLAPKRGGVEDPVPVTTYS